MRKIHLLGVAMFAMFAFSAIVVSQAFALESVWLDSGVRAVLVPVDSEGELLLENNKTGTQILCSGLNEGIVGGFGAENNSKLDETAVIKGLAGEKPIKCTFEAEKFGPSCEHVQDPTAEALGLPWKTELLLEGTIFLDDIIGTLAGGAAGWLVTCLIFGATASEECTVVGGSADIDNETGGVLALFSPLFSKNANCTNFLGVKETEVGVVEGEILILAKEAGLEISVSEG
jgi:hypothetical protein